MQPKSADTYFPWLFRKSNINVAIKRFCNVPFVYLKCKKKNKNQQVSVCTVFMLQYYVNCIVIYMVLTCVDFTKDKQFLYSFITVLSFLCVMQHVPVRTDLTGHNHDGL